MKVLIKSFDVSMEVKNKGVELDVSDTDGKHIGDLVVTKTGLIWCAGRTQRQNGKRISWKDFIAQMEAA